MKFHAVTRASGLALLLLLFATGFISTAAADPSPTGRSPKLLWTPERQAIWNRMKADYDRDRTSPETLGGQWYKVVKENAECECRYGDTGLWATFMYQWTGDKRYVDLAWKRLVQFIKLPPASTDGNYIREHGMEKVIVLDWLWPGLSAAQRTELTTSIASMLTNALKTSLRLNDSDQVVGTYFAVVLFDLTNPGNVQAEATFRHKQIGGLQATAADFLTARNAIRLYVELSAGGEWIESGSYNLGTVPLLFIGAEAVRTATGVDHFPEVTRWTPLWAKRQIAFWSPDLKQSYQWGDEENPRDPRLFRWTITSGLTAGLLQGSAVGAQLQQQLLDLVAKYGSSGGGSMEPGVNGRLFFTFNPYAPVADWRNEKTFQAEGMGLLLQRSGFGNDDSLFAAHLAPRPGGRSVDHAVHYLNDFELWRKGEWAITHPRGYGGIPITGPGTNAVLMHGFGDMPGFKELVGSASGDTFAYQAGTTGGASVRADYYQPPPVFVHEWTRSLLYVAGASDTIIIHDRAHVTDIVRPDRYHVRDRPTFEKAPSPKQWILHTPVAPQMNGGSSQLITWSTPGGQPVTWAPLLPAEAVRRAYDELALRKAKEPGWTSNVNERELKHHVKVWPSVKKDWDTFLNVVQVGAAGDVALVTATGDVEGARVSRPGEADILALFNAQPSGKLDPAPYHSSHADALRRARLRSTGYSAKWTATGGRTDVYIADLDPAKRWSFEVDGRVVLPVGASSSDIFRFTVTGSGGHSLTVTATGNAAGRNLAVPTAPAAPSGLSIIR